MKKIRIFKVTCLDCQYEGTGYDKCNLQPKPAPKSIQLKIEDAIEIAKNGISKN